jgi:hypothetical protein
MYAVLIELVHQLVNLNTPKERCNRVKSHLNGRLLQSIFNCLGVWNHLTKKNPPKYRK